jgi:hypothetical protein
MVPRSLRIPRLIEHRGRPVQCSIALIAILAHLGTSSQSASGAENAAGTGDAPTAFAAPSPQPVSEWGMGNARSELVPALEIPGFQFLLNRFDHSFEDAASYPSPVANFHTNLHRDWVVDNDKFSTNQFLHPYQGSVYQSLARSAGLGFWEASAYTFAGSLVWEEAGENTAPSINDQIATGIGGNFLGEPLFRLASLLLETDSQGGAGWLRELGAALISPGTGFNRLAYGRRFSPVFRSNDPAVFTRIDLNDVVRTRYASNIAANADPSAPPATQKLDASAASAVGSVAYGLPGKPDYSYERPFDYFNLEFAFDSADGVESIFSRGLLIGAPYEAGHSYRGIWGLYGLYDYSAPNLFRVSSTAGALGTTAQWWLSRDVALQGTALAGVGYAGGGVIHGAGLAAPGPNGEGQRNYHYGVAPESVLALRLIFSDRAALEATGRGYYISGVGATESTGNETLERIDVALTVRVFNLHGITVRYSQSIRDGRYTNQPNSHQTVRTATIGYTLLGHARFGAVDWRPATDQ